MKVSKRVITLLFDPLFYDRIFALITVLSNCNVHLRHILNIAMYVFLTFLKTLKRAHFLMHKMIFTGVTVRSWRICCAFHNRIMAVKIYCYLIIMGVRHYKSEHTSCIGESGQKTVFLENRQILIFPFPAHLGKSHLPS